MTDKLVDVLKNGQSLLHTFPVKVAANAPAPEKDALAKGAQAAAYAGLATLSEKEDVTVRLHVDRPGPVLPPYSRLPLTAETKDSLEQGVREQAYRLWEESGRPEGCAEEFWHRAYQQHIRERAYRLWEAAGRPEGRAEEFWHQTIAFESE